MRPLVSTGSGDLMRPLIANRTAATPSEVVGVGIVVIDDATSGAAFVDAVLAGAGSAACGGW